VRSSFVRGWEPLQYSDDLIRRTVRVVVDHDVIEPRALVELPRDLLETPGEVALILRATGSEATFELVHGRRLKQDQHRRWHLLAHLVRPLHVDLQEDVGLGVERLRSLFETVLS
jgi:hypothetical protein